MAFQQTSDYVEVDQNGDYDLVTLGPTGVTVTTINKHALSYFRRDRGAAFYGDFRHRFKLVLKAGNPSGLTGAWAISNGANTLTAMAVGNDGLSVQWIGQTSLRIFDYTNNNSDISAVGTGTFYWEVERASTTMPLTIYSDSGFSVLVDTLTIPCGVTTYRYQFFAHSSDAGGNADVSFDIDELDLLEDAAAMLLLAAPNKRAHKQARVAGKQ